MRTEYWSPLTATLPTLPTLPEPPYNEAFRDEPQPPRPLPGADSPGPATATAADASGDSGTGGADLTLPDQGFADVQPQTWPPDPPSRGPASYLPPQPARPTGPSVPFRPDDDEDDSDEDDGLDQVDTYAELRGAAPGSARPSAARLPGAGRSRTGKTLKYFCYPQQDNGEIDLRAGQALIGPDTWEQRDLMRELLGRKPEMRCAWEVYVCEPKVNASTQPGKATYATLDIMSVRTDAPMEYDSVYDEAEDGWGVEMVHPFGPPQQAPPTGGRGRAAIAAPSDPMQVVLAQNAALMKELMRQRQQPVAPAPDPLAQMKQFAEIAKLLQPQQQSSDEQMLRGFELARELSGPSPMESIMPLAVMMMAKDDPVFKSRAKKALMEEYLPTDDADADAPAADAPAPRRQRRVRQHPAQKTGPRRLPADDRRPGGGEPPEPATASPASPQPPPAEPHPPQPADWRDVVCRSLAMTAAMALGVQPWPRSRPGAISPPYISMRLLVEMEPAHLGEMLQADPAELAAIVLRSPRAATVVEAWRRITWPAIGRTVSAADAPAEADAFAPQWMAELQNYVRAAAGLEDGAEDGADSDGAEDGAGDDGADADGFDDDDAEDGDGVNGTASDDDGIPVDDRATDTGSGQPLEDGDDDTR